MIDVASAPNLCVFNVRGLKKRLHTVDQLAKEALVLGVCETWIRGTNDRLEEALDGSTTAPPSEQLNRGYGGVGIIIHPLVPYEIRDRYSTSTIQTITATLMSTTVSVVYISPRATAEQETTALSRIHKISGERAVVMGDMNARHTAWDKVCNPRGRRIARWARKNAWRVIGPDEPSFRTAKGESYPDLFMVKGVRTGQAKTRCDIIGTGSDHLPVQLTARLDNDKKESKTKRGGCIPRKQRRNPALIAKAKEQYKTSLTTCLEKIKAVKSRAELEEAYKHFKEVVLCPWENARREKPSRFRPWWNETLDEMAKYRRRLYRRALKDGTDSSKKAYADMDKRIKYYVKKNKEKQHQRLTEYLARGLQNTSIRTVKQIWNKDSQHTPGEGESQSLEPAAFTRHMSTPPEHCWTPPLQHIKVDETTRKAIESAIRSAPHNKAAGVDEVFVEALRVETRKCSEIIGQLWEKCTETEHVLNDWSTALFVPIYKKGDKRKAESYRPIALLSHVRKVIESAIASIIKKQYKFSEWQLGFQAGVGTENAIIRHIGNAEAMDISAVLDLRSAYDSVPREHLYKVAESSLERRTMNMIGFCLQPVKATTQGDRSKTKGTIARGVCQGSPLSPTLFNVYMDTLPAFLWEKVRSTANGKQTTEQAWQMTLFADDVKIQAKDDKVLQRLLDAASGWACKYGMTWNSSKCTIIRTGDVEQAPQLKISGREIKNSTKAEYLGITATAKGTAPDATIRRIGNAVKMAMGLRNAGIHFGKATTTTLIRIWETLIVPRAAYGVHLVPLTNELKEKWDQLERLMLINTMGCFSPKNRERLRTVGRVLSLTQTREVRMTALQGRILQRGNTNKDQAAKVDIQNARVAKQRLHIIQNLDRKLVWVKWRDGEKRRKRRLPELPKNKRPPVLSLKNSTLRRAAIQWYCGTFPVLDKKAAPGLRLTVTKTTEMLDELTTKTDWTEGDYKEAEKLLQRLRMMVASQWHR